MTTVFVRHMVSDYKTWRGIYDAFSSVQKANGVTAEAVYQATDNPNDVTVTHEFGAIVLRCLRMGQSPAPSRF